MDFSLSKRNTKGVLNGDDLRFFYYDIGLDNLQSWPLMYDWDSVISEFSGIIDIEACSADEIPSEFVLNTIRFTVSDDKKFDNGSKSATFFRHLRNAFAHYNIVREGENYILKDGESKTTMRGFINAELLEQFCFRFFDMRDKIMSDEDSSNELNNQ